MRNPLFFTSAKPSFFSTQNRSNISSLWGIELAQRFIKRFRPRNGQGNVALSPADKEPKGVVRSQPKCAGLASRSKETGSLALLM